MMEKDREPDISRYVDAALELHGLELNEARRAEVIRQFHLLRNMSLIVESEPVPDETESANIFRL
jgi:1-carboxybiuret hydrolase subunit AtzG-like protein